MNKKRIVIAVLVLLVPAYVALSWTLGRATHRQFDGWALQLQAQPMSLFKIAERKYTGGVFSSVEEVTFELNRDLFGELFKDRSEDDLASPQEVLFWQNNALLHAAMDEQAAEPWQFTIENRIQHGPLPAFRSVGLARIESRLVLSDATREEIREVLGDNDPILITTQLGLTGAGSTSIVSPAFEFSDDDSSIAWKGVEGRFTYGRDISSFDCDLSVPGLDGTSADGSSFRMGELTFECDMERAFDDLYVGTGAMHIAGLHVTGKDEAPMSVEDISYAGSAAVEGDYVNVGVKLGIGSMQIEDFALSDMQYHLGINHLHGPTYAALARKIQTLSSSGALGDPTAGLALMGAFAEYGPQLLEHSPQFVIERIGFSMPEGEMGLTATVALDDFKREDLAALGSLALLGKLNASADVWISEALVQRDWSSTVSSERAEASGSLDKAALVQAQITQMEHQGYLKRNGERLESHIEFKGGALSANGKPLGPMLGGG